MTKETMTKKEIDTMIFWNLDSRQRNVVDNMMSKWRYEISDYKKKFLENDKEYQNYFSTGIAITLMSLASFFFSGWRIYCQLNRLP